MLGKEPGDVFCGVVTADDQQAALAGNCVLGDHAHPRLDVALVKVAQLFNA